MANSIPLQVTCLLQNLHRTSECLHSKKLFEFLYRAFQLLCLSNGSQRIGNINSHYPYGTHTMCLYLMYYCPCTTNLHSLKTQPTAGRVPEAFPRGSTHHHIPREPSALMRVALLCGGAACSATAPAGTGSPGQDLQRIPGLCNWRPSLWHLS